MELDKLSKNTLYVILAAIDNLGKHSDTRNIVEQAQSEEEIVHKIFELYDEDLVWYVCYGSNLCLKRFMRYLTGDALPEYNLPKRSSLAFTDQKTPRAIKLFQIPYELYFAEQSGWWDNGSVAFIDCNKPGKTYGRAYLVSRAQYEHVKEHEGDKYQYQIGLGTLDGYPAYTFTNEYRFLEKHPVSPRYQKVIIDGLVDAGMKKEDAKKYLEECLKR